MANRQQDSSGPRTEAKQERQLFLAGLYRKGVPQAQIYRVMIAKFGVTVQTVRKDVKALGLAARRVMDAEEIIEAETAAALDRLKARAQRDDSVGNAADQLILNLLNQRQARGYHLQSLEEQARLRRAQASIASVRATMAEEELSQTAARSAWTKDAGRRLSKITKRIIEQGSATMADMVEVLGLLIQRQLREPDDNSVHIMQSLRLLARITLSDPSAQMQDHHLFKVPDGMLQLKIKPDAGDELLE